MENETKHFTVRVTLMAVLVAVVALVGYNITGAQSTCGYYLKRADGTNIYEGTALTATAGQSVSVGVKVESASPGCGTDTVYVEVVDTNWTPVNWCAGTSVTIDSPAGQAGSAIATISCYPPTGTVTNTYNYTVRTTRAGTTTNSAGFQIQVNGTSANTTPTTCPSSQTSCPAVGSYTAGCYSACPTASNPGITCDSGQIVCWSTGGTYAPYCYSGTTCQTTSPDGGGTMTLYGTVFRNGQYVDPATGNFRSCVSPSGWMKESSLNSGERGFHCMPNYTTAASDNPPSSCTGTLWAGNDGSFSSDYCASARSTTGTTITTCPSGQTMCPAIGNSPAGCYTTCPTGTIGTPTTSQACPLGQTCSASSWCDAGNQRCYTTTGDIQCISSTQTCSATGLKYCSSNDTNCLEPGATGTSDTKWCGGSSSKCWKKNSTTKEFICNLNTSGTTVYATSTACPTGYTHCSSTDTNCRDVGETGPSDAWCWGGNKCNFSDGTMKCVGWGETCPTGAKLCSSNDTNCIEPGESSAYASNKWCAGPSLPLYSTDATKILCVARTQTQMNDPNWTPTVPAGYRFCRPDSASTYSSCLEPGQTGSSSGWCAWMPYTTGTSYTPPTTGTTRTCPAIPGYTPPGGITTPPPTQCPSGQVQCPAVGNSPAGCYATCPTVTPPPPTECPTGQRWCPAFGGGSPTSAYFVGACMSTKEACPGSTSTCPVPITACPAGTILKSYINANGCQTTSCESDYKPPVDTTPVCKEGEGFGPPAPMPTGPGGYYGGPSCRVPYWCFENGAWTQKQEQNYPPHIYASGTPAPTSTAYSLMPPAPNITCTTFRVEELEWKTAWAKKWDPAKVGAWYWPNYPKDAPYYKYDPTSDSMVSCDRNAPYPYATVMPAPGVPLPYYAPCQQMAEEDKPIFLLKYRTEKKMYDARNTGNVWPIEPPVICTQVLQPAMNKATKQCKVFPTPCDIPKDWMKVPSCDFKDTICPLMPTVESCPAGSKKKVIWESPACGKYYGCESGGEDIICPAVVSPTSCPLGQVLEIGEPPCYIASCRVAENIDPVMCQRALGSYFDEVKGHRFFLRDIIRQISEAPEQLKTSIAGAKELVERTNKSADQVYALLKKAVTSAKCSPQTLKDIEDRMNDLRERIQELNKYQQNLRMVQECQFFESGLDERVANLTRDAARFEKRGEADFAKELYDAAASFKTLKPKAKSACDAVDTFALDSLRLEMMDIEERIDELFRNRQGVGTETYVLTEIENIRSGIAFMREKMEEENLENACKKVDDYMGTVEDILDDAEEAWNDGDKQEAAEKLGKAHSFREIVFDAAKQCGLESEFDTGVIVDNRILFEGIEGMDEEAIAAIIEKVVSRVVGKTVARIETFLDEQMRTMLSKAQELQASALEQLVVGVDNLKNVLRDNQEKLSELIAIKEKVVAETNSALEELRTATASLAAAERENVRKSMERAAVTVWCGDLGTQVYQRISLMRQSLDQGDVTREDARLFAQAIDQDYARNPQKCFEEKVSRFHDEGMSPEAWFFTYMNSEDSPFKGKFGPDGKPLNIVEHGRQALWMEGTMVVARVLDIPNVDKKCDVPAAIPGASNVPYGACVVDYFIDHDIPLPEGSVSRPMTRSELAQVIMNLAGNNLPVEGRAEHLVGLKDAPAFNTTEGQAIATAIANKIMLGKAEGTFAPEAIPTRAELAAVAARLEETTELTQ